MAPLSIVGIVEPAGAQQDSQALLSILLKSRSTLHDLARVCQAIPRLLVLYFTTRAIQANYLDDAIALGPGSSLFSLGANTCMHLQIIAQLGKEFYRSQFAL